MKKTLTVNLGGTVFNIDEDAYRLLDNYLCNLKHYFKKEESADEIVDDIERRISELFAEKMTDGLQVITVADVEAVIAQVGKPEEMAEDGEGIQGETADGAASDEKHTQETRKVTRRLFRNPDDKMIGGVAGGLAAYFGWSATAFRLALLLVLSVGFSIVIPLYIILWIVVPEAQTAAERLSMRGEEVTVENIGKTVTDGFDRMAHDVNDYVKSGKPRSVMADIGAAFVSVVGWILKIGLVVIALFCSPFLFIAAIMLLALLFAAVVLLFSGADFFLSLFPMAHFTLPAAPMTVVVSYISITLLCGIPLLAVVYSIFRPLFKWQAMAAGLKLTLVLLWLISVVVFIICFYMFGGDFPELLIPVHYM